MDHIKKMDRLKKETVRTKNKTEGPNRNDVRTEKEDGRTKYK